MSWVVTTFTPEAMVCPVPKTRSVVAALTGVALQFVPDDQVVVPATLPVKV